MTRMEKVEHVIKTRCFLLKNSTALSLTFMSLQAPRECTSIC